MSLMAGLSVREYHRAVHDDDETKVDAPPGAASVTRAGTTLLGGRYELLGLLGSGGMGTVYRARDRELDEIVALKALKKELAGSAHMIESFRREVKLARKVTHVNIARTFDIGADGHELFLTMEFIDGEPLSVVAARTGPMAIARLTEIAREVLEGLSASHEAGVVHGDLKPQNVICARTGRTVLTDFGIARSLHEARTGGTMSGTPAYMAPEQVEVAPVIDGRADLYALGCMLFRLVTGALPWKGATPTDVANARLTAEPPDPRTLRPDLPDALRAIIVRCMARDPAKRFASARAVIDALMRAGVNDRAPPVVASTPMTAPKSVAVLPIRNDGPAEDEYLAGGLTDDLVDVLSIVPQLRVRPRGVVAAYGGSQLDARNVGRALDVEVLIEGSVRHAGDNMRATLRVVTVEDGFQLWAKRFERPQSAFFAIADEAAAEIATVLASEKVAAARESITDPIAMDLFLRGKFISSRSYFAAAEAVGLLRAAHDRAPHDARIAAAYALALMRQCSPVLGGPPARLRRDRRGEDRGERYRDRHSRG
jgi:eukaryotic-like serine/threonine-protein kinase